MRKLLLIMLSLVLLAACVLPSCSDDVPLDPSNMVTGNWEDGLDNVSYCGWDEFISDGTYLISENYGRGMNKLNLLSGSITPLNVQDELSDERDELLSFGHSSLKYIENGVVYGHTFVRDEAPLPGEKFPQTHYQLISCNIATGYVETMMTVTKNDFESLSGVCYSDGYAYYQRMIPKVDKPSSVDDYDRTFCKRELATNKETVLFTATDENRMSEQTHPAFVENGWIYFIGQDKGSIWRTDMEGENCSVIAESKAWVDRPGTYYSDGWVYYILSEREFTEENVGEFHIYRTNLDQNKTEKLSSEPVDWFYVTNNRIYYGFEQFEIKRMDRDGSNVTELPPYELDFETVFVHLSGIYLAGDCLWLQVGYSAEAFYGGGVIRYDLADGSSEQIGYAWEEGRTYRG